MIGYHFLNIYKRELTFLNVFYYYCYYYKTCSLTIENNNFEVNLELNELGKLQIWQSLRNTGNISRLDSLLNVRQG